MILTAIDVERFWSRVTKTQSCWEFASAKDRGYGSFTVRIDGRNVAYRSHRVAWFLTEGTEPAVLDHACRNRGCVNPGHLRPVSNTENVLLGIGPTAINARKMRCASGHEFTPDNTRIRQDGARQCRTCTRNWARQARARKRVVVAMSGQGLLYFLTKLPARGTDKGQEIPLLHMLPGSAREYLCDALLAAGYRKALVVSVDYTTILSALRDSPDAFKGSGEELGTEETAIMVEDAATAVLALLEGGGRA